MSTSDDDARTKSDARVEVEMSSSSGYAAVSRAKRPLTTTRRSFVMMATAESNSDCLLSESLIPLKSTISQSQITKRRRGQELLSSDCLSNHDSSPRISSEQRFTNNRCYLRRSPSNSAKMNLFYGAFVLSIFASILSFIPSAEAAKQWSVDELLTLRFPYQTSNDLYLDVCKAGKR